MCLKIKEVEAIWDKFATPPNVRGHCKLVSDVASFISFSFNQAGIKVNTELVEVAGLLHDSLKQLEFVNRSNVDIKTKKRWLELKEQFESSCPAGQNLHEFAISKAMSNYPELSLMLIRHGYENMLTNPPKSWEEKILNYADKRCKHTEIVSLKERFEDGHKRYSTHTNLSDKIDPIFFELEKEIFSHLNFSPDELEEKMYEKKLIIFDYDGVLVDSLPLLFECHTKTCQDLNIKPPFSNFSEFGDFFAVSWNDGVDKIAPNNRDEYWEQYRKRMFESIPKLKLFPGIVKLIDKLNGKKLCIVSDSREKYVLGSLENNKIKDKFFHVVAGKYKDKPDTAGILECIRLAGVWKTNTTYVGDMFVDIQTAKNANVRCVAVSFGYHEKKHLYDAYRVVNNVEELSEEL